MNEPNVSTPPTRPHVCIVTSAHPTDDVRMHTKFAQSFLANGWSVSWVGPDLLIFDPTAQRNPDISYHFTSKSKGRLGRVIAPFKLRKAARPVTEVDWWLSPDPDAARVAIRLAKSKGGRAAFDIHEVFHEGHLDRWTFGRRIGWLSRLVKNRIRSTCARSDLVLSVGLGVLQHYVTGLHTPSLVVRNCAPASFADAASSVAKGSRELRVMHGKASPGNGTPKVLESLRTFPSLQTPIRIIMICADSAGDYSPTAIAFERPGVAVAAIAPVSHSKMPSITAECDVGMISYQRDLGVDSMPNRLFEYMAAGVAIFAPEYSVELKTIVLEEGIGITADFESAESVADGLTWLSSHPTEVQEMGSRAREAFLSRHCWEAEFEPLLKHLSDSRSQ